MSDNELVKRKQYSMEDFKAFNYVFHGKRDTDIRVFNENRKITRDDIAYLHGQLSSKLDKENIITNLFSFNLNLSNGNLKEYSNWEVYSNENLVVKEETLNITIEYDFSVKLPFYEIPQRHTLKIRIGGALRPDEFFKLAINGSEDHELIELTSDVICKVDFINYHLANELSNIVKSWYEALPKNKPSNGFVKFANRHTKKIEEFFKLSFMVIGALLMYYFSKVFLFGNLHQNPDVSIIIDSFFKAILSCAIIIYLFFTMGKLYADRITKKIISRFKYYPILILTQGDKNKAETIQNSNTKQTLKLIVQIGIGIAANGLTYLIGEWITK